MGRPTTRRGTDQPARNGPGGPGAARRVARAFIVGAKVLHSLAPRAEGLAESLNAAALGTLCCVQGVLCMSLVQCGRRLCKCRLVPVPLRRNLTDRCSPSAPRCYGMASVIGVLLFVLGHLPTHGA